MHLDELTTLLVHDEAPNLEFKESLHAIFSAGEGQRRHKDELIRDLLSLANGNTTTAGEVAYLIFGVSEQRDAQGQRMLCGIAGDVPSRRQLLDLVRPVSDPPIADLLTEEIMVVGKRLFIVTLFASPHLHETTRWLETPTKKYSPHIVFIRRGEEIAIASAKERRALEDIKDRRYRETLKIDPRPFGAVVGGMTGGLIAHSLTHTFPTDTQQRPALVTAATMIGSMLGWGWGSTYRLIKDTAQWIRRQPPPQQMPLAVAAISLSVSATLLLQRLLEIVVQRKSTKRAE